MDFERAQEILESNEKIEVTWGGEPVWIDSVDPTSGTAKIRPERDPKAGKIVPVGELQER